MTNINIKSGRSMIEMMGVIAIMLILTAGAFRMISWTMNSIRRSETLTDVFRIALAIDNPSEVNGSAVFNALGSDKNKWNGRYEISSRQSGQYTISITDLSEDDCRYFQSVQWNDPSGKINSRGAFSSRPSNCSNTNNRNTAEITFTR